MEGCTNGLRHAPTISTAHLTHLLQVAYESPILLGNEEAFRTSLNFQASLSQALRVLTAIWRLIARQGKVKYPGWVSANVP